MEPNLLHQDPPIHVPNTTPIVQEPVKVPVSAIPERPVTLEREVSDLKHRLKWLSVSWWVLLVLLILSCFGLAFLNIWDTRALRDESFRSGSRLDQRIDDTGMNAQQRLEARATTAESRIDQLLRDNAALRTDLSVLKVKVETQEAMCQNACAAQTK